MELKWLFDFLSLANTGNFSRSAEERNVTQSAFSRRIQSLEHWLGAELVNRKTHPITLTDAGIRFIKPAENMIRLAEHFREDFGDRHVRDRQSLVFASSTNLATSFLPPWLNNGRQGFEPFDVKVLTDISGIHNHFESLRTGQTDFLLHYGHGVSMLAMDAGMFEVIVVGRDTLLPVCHHSIQRAIQTSMVGKSKNLVPYLSPLRTTPIAKVIADKFSVTQSLTMLDTQLESSTVGCTKGFVELGLGLAWLPATICDAELASGEFIQIGDDALEIPMSIELYRYATGASPIASRFWKHLKA